MIIDFVFNIIPKSKENIKSYNLNGKYYLPPDFKQWENDVAEMAIEQMNKQSFEKPFECDLIVTKLNFYYDKSIEKKDYFNANKSIFDALQNIVYKNDCQIIGFIGHGMKYLDKENPRIELSFKTVEDKHNAQFRNEQVEKRPIDRTH